MYLFSRKKKNKINCAPRCEISRGQSSRDARVTRGGNETLSMSPSALISVCDLLKKSEHHIFDAIFQVSKLDGCTVDWSRCNEASSESIFSSAYEIFNRFFFFYKINKRMRFFVLYELVAEAVQRFHESMQMFLNALDHFPLQVCLSQRGSCLFKFDICLTLITKALFTFFFLPSRVL